MTKKIKASLAGRTILVTRPAEQADDLRMLIAAKGGRALMLPAIKIVAIEAADILQSNNLINRFDRFIFVSRNAVYWAFKNISIAAVEQWPVDAVFALGAGTAAALKKQGLSVVSHAGPNAHSEALLATPAFDAGNINGSRILLIKGEGGRVFLQNELTQRGADVTSVDVYRRSMPRYNKLHIWWQWRRYMPDTIIVTSNEGLLNLIRLTPKIVHACLFNSILIVLGKRTAALAKKCGFKNQIFVAKETSNIGLMQALYRYSRTKNA